MNSIDKALSRTHVQQIRELLLYGVECSVHSRTYKERIDSAVKTMTGELRKRLPEIKDYDEMTDHIFNYGSAVQDIFMEVGIRAGAAIMFDLLQKAPDDDSEDKDPDKSGKDKAPDKDSKGEHPDKG